MIEENTMNLIGNEDIITHIDTIILIIEFIIGFAVVSNTIMYICL